MLSIKDLDKRLNAVISRNFPGAVLAIADADHLVVSSSGNLNSESQYFIASATKLYTTALILQLVDSNKLKLTDRLNFFFLLPKSKVFIVIKGWIFQNKSL